MRRQALLLRYGENRAQGELFAMAEPILLVFPQTYFETIFTANTMVRSRPYRAFLFACERSRFAQLYLGSN